MSKNKQTPPNPPSGGTSRRQQLRQQQAQAEREKKIRNRVTFSVLGVVLAVIVGVVVWGIVSATKNKPAAPTASAATQSYALVTGQQTAPVTISIYQDFMCPYCGQFERANRDDLKSLVADGTAKVELHLMNFLDSSSQGTNYSTRAANALVTVAKAEPGNVMAFNAALYDSQPQEGTSGLSDQQIADLARGAGVSDAVISTFAQMSNVGFVNQSNQAAAAAGVTSTPTIKINGTDFSGQQIFTAGALKSAVNTAAGK